MSKIVRMMGVGLAMLVNTATAATWVSNFESARAQAATQHRPILINFTGSDWCPACMELKSTVLDKAEFKKFADERLVLMEVDFPRRRPISALHRQANEQLAKRFRVTAFPTLLLVDASGESIGDAGFAGTPKTMIGRIERCLASYYSSKPKTKEPRTFLPGDFPPEPVKEVPLFGGAITQPLPRYTNLVVKGITGTPARRLALINSEPMAAGDSASLKLGDKKVTVHCVEVRESSVVIKVDGEPATRELKLADIRAR